ncbi:MAG: PAS domain S-box protein [Ardenticatenia bacterium]|nr:PAS domain S-box protein [Ardenticatenia bacterium]
MTHRFTQLLKPELIRKLDSMFIEPHFQPHSLAERRQARVTAATLFFLATAYTLGNGLRILFAGPGPWLYYALPVNVILYLTYLIGRTAMYKLSAWSALVIMGGVLLRQLSTLQDPTEYEVLLVLVWFLYLLYLAAIMLPLRHFWLYGGVFFVSTLALVIALPEITSGHVALPLVLYMGSVTVLTWTAWIMERSLHEIQENEDRLRALLAVVNEAIILHDGVRVLDVNDAFERIFGLTRDHVLNCPLCDIVSAEMLVAAEHGEQQPIRWQRAPDDVRYVEVAQRPTRYRGRPAFALRLHDVTARVHAQHELERQYQFIVEVINALESPFYVLDAETYEVVLANRAAAQDGIGPGATCYAITHLRETPCDGLEHPCPLQRVKETHRPYTVEHIHYHADGSPYFAEVRGYPLFDEKGHVRYMVEYSVDVTERKRMERQLQEAYEAAQRASDFKTSLLANMSHDVRTPLGGIIGYAEMLREGVLDEEEIPEALEHIITSAQYLLDFTEGILHQAELETGDIRVVPTHFVPYELLGAIDPLENIAREKEIEIRTEVDERLPEMSLETFSGCATSCTTWFTMPSSSPTRDMWPCAFVM